MSRSQLTKCRWICLGLVAAMGCSLFATACGSVSPTAWDTGPTDTVATGIATDPDDMHVQVELRVFGSRAEAKDSDVPIRIVAPGVGEGCTPIPVGFTGRSDAGVSVNGTTRWVRYFPETGETMSSVGLPLGWYQVHVLSACVGPDGSVYANGSDPFDADVVITEDEYHEGASPGLSTLELVLISPALVSDEMLDEVVAQASGDGEDMALVEANVAAARALREEALAYEPTDRERTALEFAKTYYGRYRAVGPADELGWRELSWVESWRRDCESYIAPGSELEENFSIDLYDAVENWMEDRDSGPFWGAPGGWSVLRDAGLLSSEGDSVTVTVRYWAGAVEEGPFKDGSDYTRTTNLTITFDDANKVVGLSEYTTY